MSDSTPPPFLTKTFEMVDDPATNAVVAWSGDDTFIVKDPGQFSTNILPCYFKHNNLSSFVRQLNIYGFRKVNSDSWEFSHPNFRRGWQDLLKDIKRRKTPPKDKALVDKPLSLMLTAQGMEEVDTPQVDALLQDKDMLVSEVIRLRKQQDATQRMLAATLNELHETRCEQQRTQDTVEKVVAFLSIVVRSNADVLSGSAEPEGRPQKMLKVQHEPTEVLNISTAVDISDTGAVDFAVVGNS